MLEPSRLTAEDFGQYPPLARAVAQQNVPLLREMPTAFLALLLRELINWDWKFPAERKVLERQFKYLGSLTPEERKSLFAPFASLKLNASLEAFDWVNDPATFSEQLSAHLWTTHQIDAFRTAAVEFFKKVENTNDRDEPAIARAVLIAFGSGVQNNTYRLFRKLRPYGTYYTKINAPEGFQTLAGAALGRAKRRPEPFAHWHIDGGHSGQGVDEYVSYVSYAALTPVRAALQAKMRQAFESGVGPEAFRSMLARMLPSDLGMPSEDDGLLSRFKLSLLTEGSGTQVFSTTFVQWAAREALRRAQPLTLVARFTPRQRERPMNELLNEAKGTAELDPQGSLIDADQGAYYTWLNQQRLPGSENSSFLAWSEAGSVAVALGPKFARNSVIAEPTSLSEVVGEVCA
jgi:hypothetical protein